MVAMVGQGVMHRSAEIQVDCVILLKNYTVNRFGCAPRSVFTCNIADYPCAQRRVNQRRPSLLQSNHVLDVLESFSAGCVRAVVTSLLNVSAARSLQ